MSKKIINTILPFISGIIISIFISNMLNTTVLSTRINNNLCYNVYAANEALDSPYCNNGTLPALHVNGTTIYDSSNNPVILKGFSCASSTRIMQDWNRWYNSESLSNIKALGTNVFRITLKPEQYVEHPEYLNELEKYIDLCIENKLYVLITWMGNKDYEIYTNYAIDFFTRLSSHYKDCPNIIYEICNEPFHSAWTSISQYANVLIPIIRLNSPNAICVVPAPYSILNSDDTMLSIINSTLPYSNILYSYHMYVGSSLSSNTLYNILTLNSNNIPILISEWGTTLSSGTGGFYEDNTNIFLHFLDTNKLSWINFQYSDVYWNNISYDSSFVQMGKWDNTLSDDILSKSGLYLKQYLLGINKNYNNYISNTNWKRNLDKKCIMMSYCENYAFWQPQIREKIEYIIFDTADNSPSTYDYSWDISMDIGTDLVKAYLVGTQLYIIPQNGTIIAPANMSYFFASFSKLRSIDIKNLNTSNVTSMKKLFYECTSIQSLDLSNLDTSNVTNFSQAFGSCTNLISINLSNCNLSNATNINMMFSWCNMLTYLLLPSLNESKIVDCKEVFSSSSSKIKDPLTIICNNKENIRFISTCINTSNKFTTHYCII